MEFHREEGRALSVLDGHEEDECVHSSTTKTGVRHISKGIQANSRSARKAHTLWASWERLNLRCLSVSF